MATSTACSPGQLTGLPALVLELIVYGTPRPCAAPGTDPEEWFPPEPGKGFRLRERQRYEARARALCEGCPVQSACLELCLRHEDGHRGHGVWGGTAPWQRHRPRRAGEARSGKA